MNKKSLVFFIAFSLLAVIFVGEFASAQFFRGSGTRGVVDATIEGLNDFFGPIFGALLGTDYYDEFLFARVLLFFILLFLVRIALQQIPRLEDQKGVVWIVAIIVSILSVRYMTDFAFVSAVLIPYGVLGIALTTILPFLIFFYFVHHTIRSGVGRKIAWFVYLIILAGIWLNRSGELTETANFIYFAVFVLIIALLLFDRKIREYLALSEVRKALDNIDADNVAKAYERLMRQEEMYQRTGDVRFRKKAERYRKYLKKYGVKNI